MITSQYQKDEGKPAGYYCCIDGIFFTKFDRKINFLQYDLYIEKQEKILNWTRCNNIYFATFKTKTRLSNVSDFQFMAFLVILTSC